MYPAQVLTGQDAQRRWLTDGWVDLRRFIGNMELLSDELMRR